MPRLLDLCCGAGGASKGYNLAGFEVVGVDVVEQPRYPFEFIRADCLTVDLSGFDCYHASVPCQGYSDLRHIHPGTADKYPKLIEPMRERLAATGKPYVMENVPGAPLVNPVVLCGSMFGLCVERGWLKRHRLFECNFPVHQPKCDHPRGVRAVGVYGHGGPHEKHNHAWAFEARALMEIDWMTRDELSEAIPPVYTHHVGHYMMAHV